MTKYTANLLYEKLDPDAKRLYAIIGIMFLHDLMPNFIKVFRGYLNEKSN